MVVDLNADVGEGFGVWRLGDDDALLDVISSANVACGFHAGDARTMRTVCELAVPRAVAIGAQVGYRDLAGFGRRRIEMEVDELQADIGYQIGALDAFARAAGDRVRYVKPHGALYNSAAADLALAEAVADAVARYGPGLPLLGLAGSAFEQAAARRSVPFVAEAFADRAYTSDGRLVPRSQAGAVLTDVDQVVARSVRIAQHGVVETVEGGTVAVSARSLCVHGDTPSAVDLARAVRAGLAASGIAVERFTA
jgi:5-oxoprolinase (ATP-hydrolysing) subunit A